MKLYGSRPAIVWGGSELTYLQFLDLINSCELRLSESGVKEGSICSVLGDFSPNTCAIFFALMRMRAIIVPFTRAISQDLDKFKVIAGVEIAIEVDERDSISIRAEAIEQANQLVVEFRKEGAPGLIVFSSGSTGLPKGILHNCERVMHKFEIERKPWRSILFLLMDHFGGFNTFLAAFAYGGVAICVNDRQPNSICQTIQNTRATLLPTTPTFINLLIASRSYSSYDLSSIKLITYGTEVMSDATLKKTKVAFPNAQLKQTYGLSEVGVLRSKSEKDESPWVKIGGDGFEVKIIENILWIRSEANMVGYLNAPSPFDEEGWMCTGDQVEVKGAYMRIIGRQSEMINVGGQKVFPIEVENILLQDENIQEATVYGAKHQLMGHVVHASITLYQDEPLNIFTVRMRKFCNSRMAKYKVPVKFIINKNDRQHNDRFKKIRIGLDA